MKINMNLKIIYRQGTIRKNCIKNVQSNGKSQGSPNISLFQINEIKNKNDVALR